jgi:hypothetical protein
MPTLRRTLPFRRPVLGGATLAALACAALLLASCSSEVTPRAIPADSSGAISTSATAGSTAPTVPQEGEDAGGDVDIDVEIGECVELGGTMSDATIDNAVCGSPDSNYKVIGKAPSNDLCISDADQYYYETYIGVEQGALCLDVDWVIDGCMDLSGDDPKRVDCASPGSDTVRVVEILPGTTEVNDCSAEATSGFSYDERNFIVCTEDL